MRKTQINSKGCKDLRRGESNPLLYPGKKGTCSRSEEKRQNENRTPGTPSLGFEMLIAEISGSDQWHVDSKVGQRGGFCIILHRQLPPLASRKADPGHAWLQAKLLPTSIQAWEKEAGGKRKMPQQDAKSAHVSHSPYFPFLHNSPFLPFYNFSPKSTVPPDFFFITLQQTLFPEKNLYLLYTQM